MQTSHTGPKPHVTTAGPVHIRSVAKQIWFEYLDPETRALGLFIAGFIEHPFIYLEIVLRHSFHSKPLFEGPAASSPVDFRNTLDRLRHFVESFADESSASVLDNFRNGPAPIGQYGCSAGQRFNQYETKRFWPVIRTD